MTAIAICNPKGGVGKTTVTLNLAVLLSQIGYKVRLYDLDIQASLADCLRQRPASLPPLTCLSPNKEDIASLLKQDSKEQTISLIDFPAGFAETDLAKILECIDILLIPTNPSQIDLNALIRYIFKLVAVCDTFSTKKGVGLIINRYRKNTKQHAEMVDWFDHLSIPTVGQIRDTVNFSVSTRHGIGVSEMPLQKVKQDKESLQRIIDWVTQNTCFDQTISRADKL